jgi:large repetitive protein
LTVAGNSGGSVTSVASLPSAISAIALTTPGSTSTNNNFAEINNSTSLSGRVWLDADNNGAINGLEAGITGVAIELTGTDDNGAAVALRTVSDDQGNYSFTNLRPGTYKVTEPTQPAGTANGITKPGTVGGNTVGTATAVTVSPSAINNIVLTGGTQSINNNFGEVGSAPDLRVSKSNVEAKFTTNNSGTYSLRVRNAGAGPTVGSYKVSDKLPAGLTLETTPTGTGWTCAGAVGASAFNCTAIEVLAPNTASANAITAKVRIAASVLPTGQLSTVVNNAVLVEGGGESDANGPTAAEREAFNNNPLALPVCDAAVTQNACRQPAPVQASASISGTTWYDNGNTPKLLDAGDRRLPGWFVEVLDAVGNIVAKATTATDGSYSINNLVPGVPLTVRFRDPQSNVVWANPVNGETAPGSSGASCNEAAAIANGTFSSCPGKGANALTTLSVVLAPGQNLPQQSEPVDPSGVVYDSVSRQPVPGTIVTLAPKGPCVGWNVNTSLVAANDGGYVLNGNAASMTVGKDGQYQFWFSPTAPASCTFELTVTPPAGYRMPSASIPAATTVLNPSGPPGGTTLVQPQAGPPTGVVGANTAYYLNVIGGSAGSNILHNHIPLDAVPNANLSLNKTGDRQAAEVGDTVRYTLTVSRTSGGVPSQVSIVDRLPAGFTFVPGTAVVNGVKANDPAGQPGPRLLFNLGAMPANGNLVLQYRARLNVGSAQGDGINRATAFGCSGIASCLAADGITPIKDARASNEAQYRVRVAGGVFGTDACVLGKVYVDCNGNQVQDSEELGIPGVRLLLSNGTSLISDSEGKYSLCSLPPRSHVLKVDPQTLPRGSRLVTSSNRNLGDANSLWLDLKNGELARADFIEGSCANPVLDQVKARRAQGEVSSVETEKRGSPALRFDSKAHGLDSLTSPQQGTDSANQQAPKTRTQAVTGGAK